MMANLIAHLTLSAVRELTPDALDSLISDPLSDTTDFFDPIAKRFTPRRAVYETEQRRRQLFSRKPAAPPAPPDLPRTRRRVSTQKGGVSSCR